MTKVSPEEVAVAPQALHHLVGREVAQALSAQLLPGAGRGGGRTEAPAEGVGRDGRFRSAVLAPVDEDLALAQGLLQVRDHEVAVVRFECSRQLVRDRRDLVAGGGGVERAVEVDPLAPAGHRQRREAHPRQQVTGEECDSAHSPRPAPSPGSRSSTRRSGGRHSPSEPTRHCGTCSSSAACCASQVSPAMSSTSGYSTSREPGPAQPVGGGGGEVLLEKDLARLHGGAHSVHPALAVTRPPPPPAAVVRRGNP
ncbi:hypothetical protein SAMN06295924_11166 [Rathayibacter rathayi NCPPB 2980 = VKM Ac-1601]|nr:hypothetical protein SAMN06295924_11166 [Rathayibacter rathayi NCPPB 2980 = VKM Ac-1601]